MSYIDEELRNDVAHAQRLQVRYEAGKPIRRITIDDLGGVERHKVRRSPVFKPTLEIKAKAEVERRALASKIAQLLRANGPMTSSQLSQATSANTLRIGFAARTLGNVKSGIASGEREKTYWLHTANPSVYDTNEVKP